ncbi:Hypothetical protein CINCED_3A025179 [Cinara cedri]|uniref:Uncharacterized protein n=1 Tax=Cinara cedri TaxID=506608 RepID=A0A5E4NAJ0_9HEMI|nr:Hypothetical protein CINCED_3A025179 [Cinara cedri]
MAKRILSDTGRNCRYRNIESVKNRYKAIIQALEEEIENEDDSGVNEATVLININIASNKFQEKNATLGESKNIIEGVMMTFKNSRTAVYFSKLWCVIEIFAKDYEISIQTPS